MKSTSKTMDSVDHVADNRYDHDPHSRGHQHDNDDHNHDDQVLEVSVERVGLDTTFEKIIQVVEQAEKSKAPVQRIADRLAAGLVYFALGSSIPTFIQ